MKTDRVERILDGLNDRYLCEAAAYMEKKTRRTARMRRKAGVAAAGFAAAVVLSMAGLSLAAAAGNIPAYEILYALYPEAARKLIPVNVSCEDNGIRMEVEAVSAEGDTAFIYISMTDFTGDRIDETIDLFDSYRLQIPEDSTGTCSLIDYDEESKTALFLITVQQMNQKSIEGQSLVFSVSEFLSGKKEMEEALPEISLGTAGIVSDLQTDVDERGGSQAPGEEEEITEFLKENEEQRFSPTDGVTVTAWGFVGNRLHIQVYYEDILRTDNHGYLYLTDEQGNKMDCTGSMAFWDEARTGSYEEYIFNIVPETDVSRLSVWGYFRTCKNLTTGRWQVSFPIENRE